MSLPFDSASEEFQLGIGQTDVNNHLVMEDGKWVFKAESPELIYSQPAAQGRDYSELPKQSGFDATLPGMVYGLHDIES